jgi:hypothetical protein
MAAVRSASSMASHAVARSDQFHRFDRRFMHPLAWRFFGVLLRPFWVSPIRRCASARVRAGPRFRKTTKPANDSADSPRCSPRLIDYPV